IENPDQTAEGVDLDLLPAIPAPQVLVVQALEPGLPDEIPATRPTSREILIRGLPHVAEKVGGKPDTGIGALGFHLDRHAGPIEPPFLDARDLLEREPPRQSEWPR